MGGKREKIKLKLRISRAKGLVTLKASILPFVTWFLAMQLLLRTSFVNLRKQVKKYLLVQSKTVKRTCSHLRTSRAGKMQKVLVK